MFIVIMVLILGTCISVLSSMYYNTTSLQKTYGTVNTYYWAYYWAISSIERWLLMTKIKYPTYEWSWWFKWDQVYWSKSNVFSGDFWRLSHSDNTMIWTVNSLTNKVKWDINTKTLRVISFRRYEEESGNYNLYKYDPDTTTIFRYWIGDWLTFSWTADPTQWGRDTTREDKLNVNVDFDRAFIMKNELYTVRWLLNGQWKGQTERSVPLTWFFYFWWKDVYKSNPRPTLWTWRLSIKGNLFGN